MIYRVAVMVPVNRLFDYLASDEVTEKPLRPGVRLLVPFGKTNKVGVLVEITNQSEREALSLKHIDKVLDATPLLAERDLQLLRWASRYYHYPPGEVMSSAFPVLLRKGKAAVASSETIYCLTDKGAQLDSSELKRAKNQRQLLEIIQQQACISVSQLAEWKRNFQQTVVALMKKDLLALQDPPEQLIQDGNAVLRQTSLRPNQQQQSAIDAVTAAMDGFTAFLLEGVTGSGKTEVYLQLIQRVLKRGKQVIVLLPEITLTPQLEDRFRERFNAACAISHSRLTDKQRQASWLRMQRGQCSILLGTRSALFVPLKFPGLIILDEEHDASFKQQEGFRFSARDVAVVRGKMLNIPVLLGSATPSLESLHNVAKKNYQLLKLPERAGKALSPVLQLLDIRGRKLQEGLSEPLIREIRRTLSEQQQVLLFLNRRGFAPTLICHGCGWVARCRRCEVNLVVHYQEKLLRCHHCAHEQRLVNHCPSCHCSELSPLGLGTERVEQAMQQLFPDSRSVRLDRDTTQRKGALEEHLRAINQGEVDIILGTQMLAKGHHFPNVTLVVILDVDSGLFSIDFHATERLAQLVVQVAGRAGRAEKPGRVIMQTRQPQHPLLNTLIAEGYNHFASNALAERKQANLPPFSYQALFRVMAVDAMSPLNFLNAAAALINNKPYHSVMVLGPVSAPMARRAGRYRYQLLLQSSKRQALHELLDWLMPEIRKLKESNKVRWSLDIDPVDLY